MNREDIIKLATDILTNKVSVNFSDATKNSEALRAALIEANGGSDKIDVKTFHRGNQLFQIMEELIPVIVHEGLQGDEFFFNLVDYRNVALGDDIDFVTETNEELIVADAAYGVTGIRRQRLGAKESYQVDTKLKVVKVYDELKRFLAGRVNIQEFATAVSKAMAKKLKEDTYNAFKAVTNTTRGLNSTYVQSGSYVENDLLDLVAHVEAANDGAPAMIIGTKKALRKITNATVSDEAKSDLYNIGYFGKFNGTPMVYIPQVHKAGTDEFLFEDNKIYVIAGSDKPIKVVNKGEGLLSVNDALQSADFTQNYLYGQEYGVGLVFGQKMGFYTIA